MPSKRPARPAKPNRDRKPRRRALLEPDVTHVDYKDVRLLRAFISDRGKIRARSVTGVTVAQQRAISRAIKNAREMALLPYSDAQRRGRS